MPGSDTFKAWQWHFEGYNIEVTFLLNDRHSVKKESSKKIIPEIPFVLLLQTRHELFKLQDLDTHNMLTVYAHLLKQDTHHCNVSYQ